jgi:hypothetical protein
MSLPPHWLDSVFENIRDPDELLQTLVNSPEMQDIAKRAFEAGEKQRKEFKKDPTLCAPDVAQAIRTELLDRLNAATREEALARR